MNENLKKVTKTLSEREQIAAIIWIVIGAMQCLSFVLIISGAWNVYVGVSRLKQSKAVLTPWKGIVKSYDSWMTNIIIGLVINLVFGGVIGVAASLYDMFAVRNYVLENKQVFEEAGL